MIHSEKKGEWLVLTAPSSWEGQAVEDILKLQVGVPKKLLHELRTGKGVTLNGELQHWQQQVKKNRSSIHSLLFG